MLNQDRLAMAQERMRARDIDAYMVLTHDDYIYFFGEDRFQPRAIIPAVGPPIVVTFQGEEDEVRASLGVGDVRVFGTVGQQIKDVVGVMRQMGGGREYSTRSWGASAKAASNSSGPTSIGASEEPSKRCE